MPDASTTTPTPSSSDAGDSLIRRGLDAVEQDDLDAAQKLLDEAEGVCGENDPRYLHLAGMLAWAQDDLEHATGFLMQAADLAPQRADIRLDCAECLFSIDEYEEAETQIRAALDAPGIEVEHADEARLLLAQLRLSDDDPTEALAVLDAIADDRKKHPAYLSTRGVVLLADERYEESIACLRQAVTADGDDADLHYQLALALDAGGAPEEARSAMVRVLELDTEEFQAAMEGEPLGEPDFSQTQELRGRLEEVMEELPDPVLKLVANAPITVQSRATEEQVRAGVNPRSTLAFLGQPRQEEEDAELAGIVIFRDVLLTEVDDEDELEAELFQGLMEEIQYFFKRDDLVVAEA